MKTRRDILRAFAVAGGTAATIGSLGSAATAREIDAAGRLTALTTEAPAASLFFRDRDGRPLAIAQTTVEVMPAARGEIGIQLLPFKAIVFNTGKVVDVALVRGDVLVGAIPVGETNDSEVVMDTTFIVDGDVITFGAPLTIRSAFGSTGVLEA